MTKKLLTEVLLEADLEENGKGYNKDELRKVLSLTEADFTESFTNADDLMAALMKYCENNG